MLELPLLKAAMTVMLFARLGGVETEPPYRRSGRLADRA
jgi:hypothetical protein